MVCGLGSEARVPNSIGNQVPMLASKGLRTSFVLGNIGC